MEVEEHHDGEEAAATIQTLQTGGGSSLPTRGPDEKATSSSSTSSFSSSAVVDNGDNGRYTRCALNMAFPSTHPPRQQTLVPPLPSTIHFPTLSFMGPAQLKPIDLSTPLSVTSMTLDPDIASRIQAMYVDREMSVYAPKSSKSRAIVPVYCRHQLWPNRKHVFSKLGVPCISDRQLLTAVRNADSSKVLHYLEEGADPNVSDSKGRTPLHIAASQGLSDIASHLLSWRADPNRKDILENTPLHLAACRGDTRVVNILLRNGANINLKDGVGRTPLCIVQSRLGTLRRDRSISTDKLISECQMISDILRIHCSIQPYRSVQADVHSIAAENVLSASAIDDLCSMMKTISTREQADEIADTMIETMSQLRIKAEEEQQRKYYLSIL
ncbi:unnamed protein product [Candidula unifasciata]|uniref:Ankyrin repeat domain-containing protein 54 n=1 Tax=Candidula unifasciata TaxID=100452 RepID=A0A8S3ZPB4_9EUPU|nr:unnamed protein product [Candidula unifasciata]